MSNVVHINEKFDFFKLIEQSRAFGLRHKKILKYVWWFQSHGKKCYASNKKFAEVAECKEPQYASTLINQLVRMGLFNIERVLEDGHGWVRYITINIPALLAYIKANPTKPKRPSTKAPKSNVVDFPMQKCVDSEKGSSTGITDGDTYQKLLGVYQKTVGVSEGVETTPVPYQKLLGGLTKNVTNIFKSFSKIKRKTPPTPQGGNGESSKSKANNTPPPPPEKPAKGKKPKAKQITEILGVDFLIEQGVDEQAAKDWLAVRKVKSAPFTRSAWDVLVREAKKADITPAEAVKVCAEQNWQGFHVNLYSRFQTSDLRRQQMQRTDVHFEDIQRIYNEVTEDCERFKPSQSLDKDTQRSLIAMWDYQFAADHRYAALEYPFRHANFLRAFFQICVDSYSKWSDQVTTKPSLEYCARPRNITKLLG